MSERIVVIGDALIDEVRDDRGVREFVGGAALNVAVGLARLGASATLVAMVGDDEAGARIRSYLDDFGVELLASPSAHGSSRAVSTRSAAGEPTYVFNAAARARRVQFGAAERAAIAAAALVVVSCFPFDDVAQAAELADAVSGHAFLAIDPNPRAGMMRDRDAFVRGLEDLVAGAGLVKVGEDDAHLLYGATLDDLLPRLVDRGAGAILATYGANGAAVQVQGDVVTRPVASLPGRIVDTMGAGDAVLAATVARVREGVPADADGWGTVLEHAMQVAASTCRFEGALLRLPSELHDVDPLAT